MSETAAQKTAAMAALNQAAGFHQKGMLSEAERAYQQVLALSPANFAARHMLGVLRAQQGRAAEALEMIGSALAVNPGAPDALVNYGNVLTMLGRIPEALASYDRALAIQPRDPQTLNNRGNALRNLGRRDEALQSFDMAIAVQARHVEALYNRGNLLCEMERHGEALESLSRLLAIAPGHAGALNNLGVAQLALGKTDDALAAFTRALALQPDFVEALNNRGNVLLKLRRFDEALACFDRSLALMPDRPVPMNSRAGILLRLKRYPEAVDAYRRIRALHPDHPYALGGLVTASLNLCDWALADSIAPDVKAGIESGSAVIPPFLLLGYTDDKSQQLACARRAVEDCVPVRSPPLWQGTPYRHQKIRIAYISSDFCQHPVPALIVRLIELHDRSRFEVLGISTGLDDGSAIRARIAKAFDQFHDVQAQNPATIAALLHRLEVDIVIDLNGHTDGDSFDILSRRPCPLQVEYLGYPGTTGADFIDYVLTDPVVAPMTEQNFFSEQIVPLPDSYFATAYDAAGPAPTRAQAGLPETGFVFCCFNNSWKIRKPQFDAWMRLLQAVPGSVLWLLAANDDFRGNIRRAAQARGIDPDRLIFAPRVTPQQNLARQTLADLMLDTLPYNGHMTASDALWAGVPLVTLPGQAFASRVAASLLRALDMPELIASDLENYEALGLQLARDPARLKALREKMARQRKTAPLFDADRLRRHVEAAYVTMWTRQQQGETPSSFSLAALPRL